MDWLDLFIGLLGVAALVRGSEVGFVRQVFSTVGFFAGLFLGAWAQRFFPSIANATDTRAALALSLILGAALIGMVLGEYVGMLLKLHLRNARITDRLDKLFGSGLAIITLAIAVWLGAAVFRTIPDGGWQRQIQNSTIVTLLDDNLPSAPTVLTKIGAFIAPHNFPQVFRGLEPTFPTDTPLPDMGALTPAVKEARPSIVKIIGDGCNDTVEGSGFVAGNDEIVTNAHVVAGVKQPYVIDQNGKHWAKVVLFDPNLDIAILRAANLAGNPLPINTTDAANGTAVAILGYPNDGGFTATPGAILETFEATGRNIYNRGSVDREVYSVKADVVPGNSGGPLLDTNGEVVGVVFAKSVNYNHVGYALTMQQVVHELDQAQNKTQTVSTESCTN